MKQSNIRLKKNEVNSEVKVDIGDLVHLVFVRDKTEEEPMWVEITGKGRSLRGILKNQPIILQSEIKLDEEVEFGRENIFDIVNKSQIKKLLARQKTSRYEPDIIRDIMDKWLNLAKEDKGETKLFRISKKEADNFTTDPVIIRQTMGTDTAGTDKLFLSLIFIIVLPQILKNCQKYILEDGNKMSEVTRERVVGLLNDTKKIVNLIVSTKPNLTTEFKTMMLNQEAAGRIKSEALEEEIETAVVLVESLT